MENHILYIAKEASIYHRLDLHERLVRMLDHSRDGLILEYMENGDIKPRNFVLDSTLNIKIIDFSGSSLDGSRPASGEGTRFYLPRHWRDPPTVATDLFALGSTLYEVFQGTSPYEEIPSDQVEERFKRKEFPDVSAIPYGQIINQCWLSQVDSAEHVQAFMRDVIRSELNADHIPHFDG
ncbi:uncharacterized protein N7506_006876 [Penicillium brevicompactum]|uniref:uncharacterized protein n=1 Tax=Penicillium brevicompactum TaxID=5074 RepID=UPI002541A50E|nr:uncharacterized protein N7506_006876 [Penicillium brevicompactum]KAJ5333093.1 hypothetical protein N7506_006876 [Penicillium brevicompactum]